MEYFLFFFFFFFQAEDGIRDKLVTGVQTCALPISAMTSTYQDVLDAPEHVIAEVIAGTLYLQPHPAMPHVRVCSRLGSVLGHHFLDDDSATGWFLLDKPELHLGSEPDILVPDLVGWRLVRVPPDMEDAPYSSVAPDWVCEVLAPSTHVRDRGIKMDIYLREQVGHV